MAAAVLAFLVWGSVPDWLALGLAGLISVAAFVRLRLHRSAAALGELSALLGRVRASSASVAVAWAIAALVLVPRVPTDVEGRLLILYAGLVAAGTVTHMADGRAFHVFTGLLLGSELVALFLAGGDRLLGPDVLMVVVFWAMVSVIHKRTHRQLRTVLESGHRLRDSTAAATQQREFLDAVLRGSPEGVLLLDPSGRLARVSLEAERLLGRTESALTDFRPVDAADDPLWGTVAAVASAARRNVSAEEEVEVPGPTGEPETYRISAVQGRDAAAGWTVIQLHDVSVLRRAEAARQQAEDEYARLVESARDLIWTTDREGRWTFLNSAVEELYGWTADEMLGRVSLTHAPAERRSADRAAFARLMSGGELVNYETVHGTRTGEERVLSFSARPIRDASGEIVGAQGVARDVTAEVHARESARDLAERTSLLRSLINASEDLIFYKGVDGRYRGSNDAFAAFFGRSEQDLIGLTDDDLFDPRAAAVRSDADGQVLRTGRPVTTESWHTADDGERRLRETVRTAVTGPDGHPMGILGIARDVTERKRSEERMREMAEEAARATRMKSAFLANMSHEIRTPMNGVLGMAELLLFTNLDDEQRQYVDVVRSSADNLLGILNDILDLSKIEAEKLELEDVALDLPRLMAEAVRVLAIPAARREDELLLDVDPRLPRWIRGDPGRLRQVLTNLAGNAVKFTEGGEILVTARRLDRDGHAFVQVGVRDTGIGIPLEKQQAIFGDFEQADSSVTRQYGGTGLGLAISRHLVRMMGGEIHVESRPGEGSHFWFELPLRVAEAQPADPGETPVPDDLSGVRVLVVDDHPTNREILRRTLEGVHAEVVEAHDGHSALALLDGALDAGDAPNLILLDVQMPGLDGIALAEGLGRGPHAGIPVLILTSANRIEDARRARDLGVKGYHLKPLPRDDLLRAVAAATGRDTGEGSDPADRALALGAGVGEGATILLAEDNMVNRMVAMAMLEKAGHRVEVAGNGQEALDRVLAGGVDLVLMDVQMPEMDGVEATRRIRAAEAGGSHVPIVALTAHAYGEEEARCRDAGMDAFLSKPFHAQDLLRLVGRWLTVTSSRAADAPADTEVGAPADVAEPTGTEAPQAPVDVEAFRAGLAEAGIEEVAGPTLALFLEDLRTRVTALAEARRDADLVALSRTAHALKSGAGNVRADRARLLLQDVEARAAEGDADVLGEPLERALAELARVDAFLHEEGYGGDA
jgi:PAS domain S-box-containing protein